MSESDELYAALNYIKHKVDTLEKIEMLNLRSNKTLQDKYISLLQSDEWLLKVYKEIDGQKAQNEIAIAIDTTSMTVSNKIKRLAELGLIEIKEISRKQHIYKHSVAELAFKLTRL